MDEENPDAWWESLDSKEKNIVLAIVVKEIFILEKSKNEQREK